MLFRSMEYEAGEPDATYSIAAGLDYPGIGPEHSFLKDTERATYASITGEEALEAFQVLSRTEGITPALESAHAIAYVMTYAATLNENDAIIVNLSGRGEKDVEHVYDLLKK